LLQEKQKIITTAITTANKTIATAAVITKHLCQISVNAQHALISLTLTITL
jgi:signal recognition particle receptor subunit beta